MSAHTVTATDTTVRGTPEPSSSVRAAGQMPGESVTAPPRPPRTATAPSMTRTIWRLTVLASPSTTRPCVSADAPADSPTTASPQCSSSDVRSTARGRS